jgi:hypothetical protein
MCFALHSCPHNTLSVRIVNRQIELFSDYFWLAFPPASIMIPLMVNDSDISAVMSAIASRPRGPQSDAHRAKALEAARLARLTHMLKSRIRRGMSYGDLQRDETMPPFPDELWSKASVDVRMEASR